MEALGHLERVERRDRPVCAALLNDEPTVEQHAHRLDRVQRDPLGALQDPCPHLVRQPGHHPRQQRRHGLVGEGFEVQRRQPPLADAPARTSLGHLGARQRQHQDLAVARPLQQVLDEVEQAGVSPLQVLEDQNCELVGREALEEDAPRRVQVARVARRLAFEAQQLGEAQVHPLPFGLVGDELRDGAGQLGPSDVRRVALDDVRARAHHLGQGPVRHSLAIREAAAAVPVHTG